MKQHRFDYLCSKIYQHHELTLYFQGKFTTKRDDIVTAKREQSTETGPIIYFHNFSEVFVSLFVFIET